MLISLMLITDKVYILEEDSNNDALALLLDPKGMDGWMIFH